MAVNGSEELFSQTIEARKLGGCESIKRQREGVFDITSASSIYTC